MCWCCTAVSPIQCVCDHTTELSPVQGVEQGAANKAMDLSLPTLGPYRVAFARSGRYVAVAGRKGHLALTDWARMYTACEVQVREMTRDVCVLHNEQFFAAAQKRYTYIYDRRGLELHCCKEHIEPAALDFLPHHFLLVSAGASGMPLPRCLATSVPLVEGFAQHLLGVQAC